MGLNSELGITIGNGRHGKRNLITDVPGVTVGHTTVQHGEVNTGVTVIMPHQGNIFTEKVMAGCSVINGFGKTMGLVQIKELGTIETPIVMTNTLSIGTAATALIKYMLAQNEDIGGKAGSVNPLVCECNDGTLNDIRGLHVTEEHVNAALANTSEDFEEGAVGAGTGMFCLGLKGGIGSSSRIVELDGKEYTIGVLVLSNFGHHASLRIDGEKTGERIQKILNGEDKPDKGSIIMLIATDIPLSERQLNRISLRAGVGLARTGSYFSNGSGDIAIAFSTANKVPHNSETNILPMGMIAESKIDLVFSNTADAVEEAIISSLYHAKQTTGIGGKVAHSLSEFI